MHSTILDRIVPHLSLLKSQLTFEQHKDGNEIRRIMAELEQLPYSLSATYHAVSELLKSADELANKIKAKPFDQKGILIIDFNDSSALAFAIDNFLDAARRSQNALCQYFKIALTMRDVPDSLNDLMGKIDSKKIVLPHEVLNDLAPYWRDHGKKLKFYRDLSQHHAVVATDVRAFFVDGQPSFYLVLPNNPQNTDPRALKYENPTVHAIPYVLDEFLALSTVIYRITEYLLGPKADRNRLIVGMTFRGGLRLGSPMQGYPVPPPGYLAELIDGFTKFELSRKKPRTEPPDAPSIT